MKTVILAGGLGARISEESYLKPKPMIEVGEHPLLWHIMKIYSFYGLNEFIICCGYKSHIIKEYFVNYRMYMSDVTYNFSTQETLFHDSKLEPWTVTLVNTGLETMTGGRLKKARDYIGNETFCCTYGDGLGDVDISASIDFHKKQNTLATLTAVQPPGRFGLLSVEAEKITNFSEKPKGNGGWVNGGFFVLEPEVIDYIEDDSTVFEEAPLKTLSDERQLSAYKHSGFWQPMDTVRDKKVLESLWEKGNAPWKVW